ncbi:MAG: hypothetical protein VX294_02740 [Candidatus Latescibacterota bacterium]|nr:hypothetical protein [Candidatus Latescibacterota bacterium]
MSKWMVFFSVCIVFTTAPCFGQNWSVIRRPANSALIPPLGQGLDYVSSAEPLGKGRFRVRMHNRSDAVTVPDVGKGTIFSGHYGLAYGLGNALEVGLGLPFLMDSIDGLNRYGTGDPVISIKVSRPKRIPNGVYVGSKVLIGLPLGYTGEHALDQFNGTRSFSSGAFDIGVQLLGDLHFDYMSIYVNGGYYKSGNPDVLTLIGYGIGTEFWRSNRWLSMNIEYQSHVAFAARSEAQALFKAGLRFTPLPGVEVELSRQIGILDHPLPSSSSFGLRLHGIVPGGRRLISRQNDYSPGAKVNGNFEHVDFTRIAFVDFDGFEEFNAGARLVEKIRGSLEMFDNINMVDIKRYEDVPHKGYLSPQKALELARKLDVDIIVTGLVDHYEIKRFGGARIPFLFSLPETEIRMGMRFRVIEIDEAGIETHSQTHAVQGVRSEKLGMRFIPYESRNITKNATATQMNNLQDAVLDDLVGSMLAAMVEKSKWLSPELSQ